jgi:hypothetical protein
MTSRRAFMRTVTLATAGGCIDAFASDAGLAVTIRPAFVVFDSAIEASRSFATSVSAPGTVALDVDGDIGILWHRTIASRRSSDRVTMTGLTRASDCFVVERLCACAGARFQWLPVDAASDARVERFSRDGVAWRRLALWTATW